MDKIVLSLIIGITVLGLIGFSQDVFSQFQSGGVDKEGSWYVGEGLEEGENYRYNLCHIDYQDCLPIDLSMTAQSDLVDRWDLRFEFDDGTVSLNDVAEVDKVTFEALNIDPNDKPLFDAYENSIVWLSHFANFFLKMLSSSRVLWGSFGAGSFGALWGLFRALWGLFRALFGVGAGHFGDCFGALFGALSHFGGQNPVAKKKP